MFAFTQKARPRYWKTPEGTAYNLYLDVAQQPHTLIAGATGSGKSVFVNGIISALIHKAPSDVQFILLDPKRTELKKYAAIPHTIAYADTSETMLDALQQARRIVDKRYSAMQRRGLTEYDGGHVYVIIDELAALMTTQKKAVLPILQYLGIIARAARVHMIACTQTVKADILPTTLTCNFDSRIALRTATAQQSRMLIDVSGCELLPSPVREHRAQCYYRTGADLYLYNVPMVSDSDIAALLAWWTSDLCTA